MPTQGAEGHTLNMTEVRVLSVGNSLKIEHLRFQKIPWNLDGHGENGLKTMRMKHRISISQRQDLWWQRNQETHM